MDNKPLSLQDQIKAGRLGGFSGEDVRGAFDMAGQDVRAVEHDLSALGKESRHQGLRGEDRTSFFKGMTQHEFDILHGIAMHLGDDGMNAMERMMEEAQGAWKAQGEMEAGT